MHVLDNPVWHALNGTHATVAQRSGSAARYEPDVAAFAALSDEPPPSAWDDLRDLIGPGGSAFFPRRDLTLPDTWTVQLAIPCRQMVLPAAALPDTELDAAGAANGVDLVTLTAADVPEMLALVERTRPGPFATRTIELGTYLGVRDGGALIAMAGERIHPEGFTEISAVCTDSTHRGRGLASQLVRALVRSIRARDETPFLHLTLQNEGAHRVYTALGFETRALLDVVGVQAPA